ncbi:MAG: type III ribulose-bisphosphate carboxylase [Halobacteria archaeon]|nr:type III ribulose-bisphosphate carboxylase [Halobacteria archaeon]
MEYTDYVDEGYSPDDSELVCRYHIEPHEDAEFRRVAGGVAAESSVGTWDPDLKTMTEGVEDLAATVFELDAEANEISVAYTTEVFEPSSLPQLLSSITGNIFGLEEIRHLRLEDVDFPKEFVRSFEGPELGVEEIKSRVGADDRPLCGTIVKPKLGLRSDEHAEVAYEAWVGGLDLVKDDENLTDMEFNPFYERVEETLERKREAETETGDSKLYFPNITAPVSEMKRRADAVVENGGSYVMIDILTAGWSALQEMREYLDDGIGIHAHRAQHAAYTRLPYHGISMLSVAKFARLAGIDNLHAGTVLGKMESDADEIKEIYDFLRSDWYGTENVIPVASGGLHPGVVSGVVEVLGTDTVVQAGGGVHAHPGGTRSGARALRDAVDAVAEGVTVDEKAEESEELAQALDRWGKQKT